MSFQNGFIYLLKSYDDVTPIQINTEMNGALGLTMEWSNSKELLAVAGTRHQPPSSLDSPATPVFLNLLKFYTDTGVLLYATRIPNVTNAVSAMTWGHNDKRLFIATGTQVHIAWVSRKVASLQLLCRLQIQSCIGSELLLPKLPLPSRIKTLIGSLFAQTIRVCTNNLLLFHGWYSLLISGHINLLLLKSLINQFSANACFFYVFTSSAVCQAPNRFESLYHGRPCAQHGCIAP